MTKRYMPYAARTHRDLAISAMGAGLDLAAGAHCFASQRAEMLEQLPLEERHNSASGGAINDYSNLVADRWVRYCKYITAPKHKPTVKLLISVEMWDGVGVSEAQALYNAIHPALDQMFGVEHVSHTILED